MKHLGMSLEALELTRSNLGRKIAFSEKFDRLVARAIFSSPDIVLATEHETLAALAFARQMLPVVASQEALKVYRHNPECFRIVRHTSLEESPMMAYLPLNDLGAAALVADRFDSLSPELCHICTPGEAPSAIYLWLVLTPGHMVAGLRLLKELERIGKGVPVFTRPAHAQSAKILEMAGFLPATEVFPSAAPWLVVALTLASSDVDGRRSNRISVRVARSIDDLMKVFSIRTLTYMGEQACSYSEEFDGNDFCAIHLIGEIDGVPAGCVRIRCFGTFAKLERLAVHPGCRRSRLMRSLVQSAFELCARKGFTKLYAHARADLVPAWQRFGARLMDNRVPFFFSDVEFREMELDLPPHPDALLLGADPLVLIRPEGEWDSLGPVERTLMVLNPARRKQVVMARRLRA